MGLAWDLYAQLVADMTALIAWLGTITPAHLIGVIGLIVLLAMSVGPQETELVLLAGLLGLAIPTPTTKVAP
jgi:hypothetical protein